MFRGSPGAGPREVCEAGEGVLGGRAPGPMYMRLCGSPCTAVHTLSVCSLVSGQKEKVPTASGKCVVCLCLRLSVCPGKAATVKPCASPSL